MSSTSLWVDGGRRGGPSGGLGAIFTVLFITPEDMSLGMSHMHERTHTHPGGISNRQAEEQLSVTGRILHTANGWL